MAKEVRLPQLGQTMEEGTIVSCMVGIGDEVKKGDVIFEIETDKATLEMESPADGFVKYILAEVDQTLLVGDILLVLGKRDEEVPQSFVDSLKAETPAVKAPVAAAPDSVESQAPQAKTAKKPSKVIASPRAKKLAKELGVDLANVAGTGPAGKITEQDVQNIASSETTEPAETTGEVKFGAAIPVNRLQKITAKKMLQSKQEIPCYYLSVKADVTNLVELRNKLNQAGEVKISYNDFIIKAVAIGIERFPIMAGQMVGDTIKLAKSINIGLAISVPDGLVAPTIKDVQKKGVKEIANDSNVLIAKAVNSNLSPADLEGGCITVSNLGGFGIDAFIPIVVPGQCSILGIGRITDTAVPVDGKILVRKLMSMILSVDHKVANGAYAAQFLDVVKKSLEEPSSLA